MCLSDSERAFLRRRRALVRSWPAVGATLTLVLVLLFAWLLWSKPLLINPWAVFSRLEAGTLPAATVSLMAAMLPVAMLMVVVVVGALLLFSFSAFAGERRHLAIIDGLLARSVDSSRGAGSPR